MLVWAWVYILVWVMWCLCCPSLCLPQSLSLSVTHALSLAMLDAEMNECTCLLTRMRGAADARAVYLRRAVMASTHSSAAAAAAAAATAATAAAAKVDRFIGSNRNATALTPTASTASVAANAGSASENTGENTRGDTRGNTRGNTHGKSLAKRNTKQSVTLLLQTKLDELLTQFDSDKARIELQQRSLLAAGRKEAGNTTAPRLGTEDQVTTIQGSFADI